MLFIKVAYSETDVPSHFTIYFELFTSKTIIEFLEVLIKYEHITHVTLQSRMIISYCATNM